MVFMGSRYAEPETDWTWQGTGGAYCVLLMGVPEGEAECNVQHVDVHLREECGACLLMHDGVSGQSGGVQRVPCTYTITKVV